MKTVMKAVIDVDGVLADFEGALVDGLADFFGDEMRNLARDVYSLEKRYGGSMWSFAEEFLNRPSSYGNLAPIEHGVKFVNDLVRRGWDVMFVSSRPQLARGATERWLCWYIEDYYNTRGCLVGVNDKEVVAKEWGADVLVDDNPETVARANAIGVTAFAFEQPWNTGVFPRLVFDRKMTAYIWEKEDLEEVPFFAVYDYAEAK